MSDNNFDDFKISELDIDFMERMLKSLPSNIYFKDKEARYVFCTHYWNHLKTSADDPNWTIRGKRDIDIRKDTENAIKAMAEDLKILETGRGSTYEIKTEIDGELEYLQLIKNPVFDKEGNIIGIVGLINIITETKLLEQKLEQMATLDILTGIRNRSYLDIWLDKHAADDSIYPLSVLLADCNGLKKINDQLGHLVGDEYIKTTATTIKSVLKEGERVIRMGGDEFLVLLPKTDKEAAKKVIADIEEKCLSTMVGDIQLSVAIGSSTCESGPIRIEGYISIADADMYEKKKKSGKNRI